MKNKNIYLLLLIFVVSATTLFAGGKAPENDGAPLIARQVAPKKYKKSSDDLVVTFIDSVGQGNSIFVKSPDGTTMLYDAGGTPEWMKSTYDVGMKVIVPLLEEYGIEKIDYAVLSHPHEDHIGGFRSVFYSYDVGQVYDSGYAIPTDTYKELLKTVKSRKFKYKLIKEGDGGKIDFGKNITCSILNPPADGFLNGTNSDTNNSSILIKLVYGDVSFIFTGDTEREGEMRIIKKYGSELEANILQAGHHGSYTSSTKPFLKKVMPEVTVIPVGKKNVYGHPRPETLSNLESIGSQIYRTDHDGHVVVTTNGESFIVETHR